MTLTYRRWIWFFSILLICSPCFADGHSQQVNRWFEAGNTSYAKGDYKGAIENYERINRVGFVNETVYYNLANAYFKSNQIGRAILFYEKARRLAPVIRKLPGT